MLSSMFTMSPGPDEEDDDFGDIDPEDKYI